MTAEDAVFRVSLLLIALAAIGLWQLRDGTRLSNWLDRELTEAVQLPAPDTKRLDVLL